ncbi:DUF4136 domain-containing protein [Ramlibacter sp. RBP-2]|uniref:DUF4136 domain-containing protein n=1 Tax=Ramlibacter lithotrophicus TaxID=2606681 RepID=A0A7X6DGG5_9BURK|nr:DUF4136 domain-containing protein [Ramlibacter lithotrophicus]NKE66588.1 DUF4136 domain-containing protein [Ramlibacter lithotrophicus]
MNRSLSGLLGLCVAWLLAGCASTFLVDSNVRSFSSLAALPQQPTYRFERLPSQQEPGQAQLEAMADAALHRAGLRRDDATPRYAVQVSGRLQPTLSPWADPWRWGGGWGVGYHRRGLGLGFGGPWGGLESPWYHREVAVVVRELPSNRVVFESHASNDGPWLDNQTVFPAMFQAAMQGFPNPPPGPRRVDVQVGRAAS